MKLYVAWEHDLATPFSPSAHAIGDSEVLSITISEVEGQVAEVEIVREQTGWSALSSITPQSALISWSPTGLAEDAVLVARGRVTDVPSDLFGSRQTLILACAPRDIDKRLLDYARANLASAPWWEPLMSDADDEDPASYLVARPEAYHVDPSTHAVSVVSEVEGERIVDLTEVALFGDGRSQDSAGDGGRLVSTLRARLTIPWTQTSEGTCDVGRHISLLNGIDTLDPGLAQSLDSALTAEGEGWSSGGSASCDVSTSVQQLGEVTVYNVEIYHPNSGRYLTERVAVRADMKRFGLRRLRIPLAYDYSQDREEVVYLALSAGSQTALEADEEDVLDLSVRDIFSDPTVDDYEAGRDYLAGETVRRNGAIWRCLADHYAVAFSQRYPGYKPPPLGSAPIIVVGYWQRVGADVGMAADSYSFVDTSRGRAVVRHVMMRLRKEALRRLRFRRVRMTFEWSDAAHVTLRDAIRFDVPWAPGEVRSVVGKVTSIRKLWPEAGAPIIEIECGVSFGFAGEQWDDSGYVDDGYIEPRYSEGEPGAADVDYHTAADPISMPVRVERLRDPLYSVRNIRVRNQAFRQAGATSALTRAGRDVRDCSVEYPTSIDVEMMPLVAVPTIRREIDVVGQLVRSPQGVTLL